MCKATTANAIYDALQQLNCNLQDVQRNADTVLMQLLDCGDTVFTTATLQALQALNSKLCCNDATFVTAKLEKAAHSKRTLQVFAARNAQSSNAAQRANAARVTAYVARTYK